MSISHSVPNSDLHNEVVTMISNILSMANIQYYDIYEDTPDSSSKLPMIFGKAIKFWNIFPRSGTRVDKAMYTINHWLQLQYGLYAAMQVFDTPSDTQPGTFRTVISIVVKPIPIIL